MRIHVDGGRVKRAEPKRVGVLAFTGQRSKLEEPHKAESCSMLYRSHEEKGRSIPFGDKCGTMLLTYRLTTNRVIVSAGISDSNWKNTAAAPPYWLMVKNVPFGGR